MKKESIIYPYGELDIVYYYSEIAHFLKNFLKGKELATRTWIPNENIPYFIRRGSKDGNLFINDMRVSNNILKLRKNGKLEDYKKVLSDKEKLIWHYFVPRKYVELFYSFNGEKKNSDIERIYYDIDRKDKTAEDARKITVLLIGVINRSKLKILTKKLVILWTGKSFHVVLLLKNKQKYNFYGKWISSENENSITSEFVKEINKKTTLKVRGGHERVSGEIVIDPSQSAPGKLARAPFSIHVSKAKYDGICVPILKEELSKKNIINHLSSLTIDKIVRNLHKYYIVL